MRREFHPQGMFHDPFRQAFEQPMFAKQVFG
jgi:hypothetical protein